MPRHPLTKKTRRNLKDFDGMSATSSTATERADVLEKLLDEVSTDCIRYGFYISPVWDTPIADYFGDSVQNEISLKNVR